MTENDENLAPVGLHRPTSPNSCVGPSLPITFIDVHFIDSDGKEAGSYLVERLLTETK